MFYFLQGFISKHVYFPGRKISKNNVAFFKFFSKTALCFSQKQLYVLLKNSFMFFSKTALNTFFKGSSQRKFYPCQEFILKTKNSTTAVTSSQYFALPCVGSEQWGPKAQFTDARLETMDESTERIPGNELEKVRYISRIYGGR